MNEITVLGAGYAGLNLVKKIREKDAAVKITLLDKRDFCFDRSAYLESLSHKDTTGINDLAGKNNVNFVRCRVERINPQRKKIYLKEEEPLSYQTLILAPGLKSKEINLKGGHREGFFYFSDIDPHRVRDILKFNNDTAVWASSFLGLRLAVTLKILKKEIRVFASSLDFFADEAGRVISALNEHGIPVYLNVSLEEAIGEGAVKALKISPLKVFPAQAVFVDSGFIPNIDFFDGGPAPAPGENGIFILGDAGRTNLEGEFFYRDNHREIDRQIDQLLDILSGNKTAGAQTYPSGTAAEENGARHADIKNAAEALLKKLEGIPRDNARDSGSAPAQQTVTP